MAFGMHLNQNITQRQELRQVMTPQLQQAIKLLQYNQMDLLEHIQEEMVKNPALESIPGTEDPDRSNQERQIEAQAAAPQQDLSEQQNGASSSDISETDWQKVLEGYSASAFKSGGVRGNDDLPPIETTLSTSVSLAEQLITGLREQICTDAELVAAQVIIMNLNDHGYLTMPLEQVAVEAEVELYDAESAQMLVQSLDPIGCGSSNLEQCMIVQAKVRWPEDPFVEEIIQDHLSNFESRNYQAVARAMDMDVEDAVEYHKMLRELEPRPGRAYADTDARYITPDVHVFKVGDEWQIRLNEDGMPKLRVSPYYRQILQGAGDRDERRYIKEKLDSADFLIKSIYRRQNTIYKVVESILRRQRDFFERGVEHLRPMILQDVAQEVGVHEATVSRVTSNKYLQCPLGIFELKYFFNAGLRTNSGVDMASEAVKAKIRVLIADENPKKPLSDAALAKLLKAQGVTCARRTVAKYREAMGILSSSKRKRLF